MNEVAVLSTEVTDLKNGASKLLNKVAGLSTEVTGLKNGASKLMNEVTSLSTEVYIHISKVEFLLINFIHYKQS